MSLPNHNGAHPSNYGEFIGSVDDVPREPLASTSCSSSNSQSISSNCSTPQDADLPLEMTKLNLGGELIAIPTILVISETAFRAVISEANYSRLSPEARAHLEKLLPKFERTEENQETIHRLFTRSPKFNFGNPLGKFHAKLKGGHFGTERPSERVQLKDDQRVLYDHYIRFYHINLLKKLLVSRHALLQHYMSTPVWDEPGPVPVDPIALRKKEQYSRVQQRAAKRAKLMLGDCRARVGETGISSDEEADEETSAAGQQRIQATPAGRTTLYAAHHRDMDLHQPLYIDDVKTMQKKYKKLRKMQPNTPSLDVSGIDLDDVLERSGVQSVSERIRQTKETLEQMN